MEKVFLMLFGVISTGKSKNFVFLGSSDENTLGGYRGLTDTRFADTSDTKTIIRARKKITQSARQLFG